MDEENLPSINIKKNKTEDPAKNKRLRVPLVKKIRNDSAEVIEMLLGSSRKHIEDLERSQSGAENSLLSG